MKKIQVGWIQNTHGIKGELKVRSETDFPNIHFKKGKKLYRSQLDDDFDPEVLPWVETKRDENGYILSWEDIFES